MKLRPDEHLVDVVVTFRFAGVRTRGPTKEIAELNAIGQVARQFDFFVQDVYTSAVHYEAKVKGGA